MHKADLTVALVERLVADQFPQWAGLTVAPVELDGWDNTTFRLGDELSVRLPSHDVYVAQVDKEQRWLPVLAPHLPVAIPLPVGRGEPSAMFPRPWSVYRWIHGDVAVGDRITDRETFARDLAGFLAALYACEPEGPPPGDHSFQRGGPVTVWDTETRQRLELLDIPGAVEVWKRACDATCGAPPVWVHGDVTGANLVVRDGRLAGVIDFGCSAVGDPACDLTVAWTMFDGPSRDLFRSLVPVDAATWARAAGWALWKALIHLEAGPDGCEARDRRAGWGSSAAVIVAALTAGLDS